MAAILLIVGAGLVVAGVALISLPAALILAGAFSIIYGVLMEYATAKSITAKSAAEAESA